MQQRYSSSSSSSSPSPSPQQITIKLTEHQHHHHNKTSPFIRRSSSMADFTSTTPTSLPLYDPRSVLGKKDHHHHHMIKRSLFSEKWIHAIPVIIFISLFILFWFCYPVTVEIKDGKIVGIHRIINNNNNMSVILNKGMEIGTVASTILSQEEDIADVPLPQNFTDQENGTINKEIKMY